MDAIDIFLEENEPISKPTGDEKQPYIFEGSMDVERIVRQEKGEAMESGTTKKEILHQFNRDAMDDEFDMVYEENQQQKQDVETVPDFQSTNDNVKTKTGKRVMFAEELELVVGYTEDVGYQPSLTHCSDDSDLEKNERDIDPEEQRHENLLLHHEDDAEIDDVKSQTNSLKYQIHKIQMQWEEITRLRESQNYGSSNTMKTKDVLERVISFQEAHAYFKSIDVTREMELIRRTYPKRNIPGFLLHALHIFQRLSRYSFGRPLIRTSALDEEKRFILCLTKIPFDHNNQIHSRVLFTIYKRLTGDAFNCPVIGSHWSAIGFQGSNPSTDLRGAGILALVQLLCFLDKGKDIPVHIFQLSKHPESHFPFCAVSVNITALVLDFLRNGTLSPMINKMGSAMEAVNSCYMTLFYEFYKVWKQGKTIVDFDRVKKQLGSLKSRRLEALEKEYLTMLQSRGIIVTEGNIVMCEMANV